MGSLTWDGLFTAFVQVITAGVVLLALVTGVFGSCAYIVASGVQSIRGEPMVDFWPFMGVVGIVLVGLFLVAISSR